MISRERTGPSERIARSPKLDFRGLTKMRSPWRNPAANRRRTTAHAQAVGGQRKNRASPGGAQDQLRCGGGTYSYTRKSLNNRRYCSATFIFRLCAKNPHASAVSS